MARKIALIHGHPDDRSTHFGHALADAYALEADIAGHEVKRIDVAKLGFPLLRSKSEWEASLPACLQEPQAVIGWADHLVLIFPLWLGTMPALLKGFLEQVLRPGFAFENGDGRNGAWKTRLNGKSARIVVTMGMPAFWYRWFFLAHGVKGLERNVLKFCGIRPVRETFVGMIETNETVRHRALAKLRALGRAGR